ncbi:MAG: HAD hydrolase-like protein [Chloroflexi bacterium]|nr:HAD hydrolase-like protein [Chloroflexota bacterium]
MQPKYLVLFDIDGTLLHSGGCGRAATRLAVHDVFGTTGALDQVDFAGMTDWGILHAALEPTGIARHTIESQLPHYMDVVAEHLAAIIDDFPVRPCAGAPEVVTSLRDNPSALLGLVTGNMASLVPIKLQAAEYDTADFKIGAYGSEGWQRPMLPPLALERARTYSGVDLLAEHTVIIGDTPGDITCAASIGARTIAVATGPFSMEQLSAYQPDHVFETLANEQAVLAAILKNGHLE